jgi:histidyl-tRNA synthetase
MRKAGISADKDYENKKMKAQLKQADRLQAKFVIIIGDEELEKGVANVKNMATGEQDAVAFERLAEYIKERK